jgi:flavin-dependent dehydrogenase
MTSTGCAGRPHAEHSDVQGGDEAVVMGTTGTSGDGTMYDAIVVGARCAGSPTAMLLARKGYRVLLVDRATFPSDSVRLHYIQPPGIACLKRWGLLERLAATNCPPTRTRTIDMDDFPLRGGVVPIDGVDEAYSPRRKVLDKLLVDAAVEAGAELREGFSVDELVTENGTVVGIRGRARGGSTVTERASIVIGADGQYSRVAGAVEAPIYRGCPPLICYYGSYWSDVPTDEIEIYRRERQVIYVFPTNDALTSLFIGWPQEMFRAVRADVERHFWQTIDLVPHLAERVRNGRRVEPFIGAGDLPSFFRRSHGPGWALVGDAGYHKDPYLGQGITDAFRGAALLADAVDAGLSGRAPLGSALAAYERRRDEAVMPLYELNCRLAELGPLPPEQRQLRAALRDNPEDTRQYFGVTAGTVPIRQFFAPENIGRILAAAKSRESVPARA